MFEKLLEAVRSISSLVERESSSERDARQAPSRRRVLKQLLIGIPVAVGLILTAGAAADSKNPPPKTPPKKTPPKTPPKPPKTPPNPSPKTPPKTPPKKK
jgi:hypothetical protein